MSRLFGGEGLRAARHVLRAYPALLRVGFADILAYRAELVVWLLTINMPLVMMALWTAVAASGPVDASGVECAHTQAVNLPASVHTLTPGGPDGHGHARLVPETHSGGRSTVACTSGVAASCPASGSETTWRPPDVTGEDAPPVVATPPVPVLPALEPPATTAASALPLPPLPQPPRNATKRHESTTRSLASI